MDSREEGITLEFSLPCFLINVFSADPLLSRSPLTPEKEQFLWSVLVFEQKTKQRQLNAQINKNFLPT